MAKDVWLRATALAAFMLGTWDAAAAEGLSDEGGFYLRGDLGTALTQSVRLVDDNVSAPNTLLLPNQRALAGDLGDALAADIGAGYRFSPLLRGDLTLTGIPNLRFKSSADLSGLDPTPSRMAAIKPQGGGMISPATGAEANGKASADVETLMLTGYLDLAPLAPEDLREAFTLVQPYIGAGIGVARTALGPLRISSPGQFQTVSGDTRFNFAWGVSLGVGVPLDADLTLDIAYRFLDVGGLGVKGSADIDANGAVARQVAGAHTDDLLIHSFTVGLRWGF